MFEYNELEKIVPDLLKAKSTMPQIYNTKNVDMTLKSGRRVKYNYIELPRLLEAIQESLLSNNIYLMQHPVDFSGKIGVETILMHSSGAYIKNTFLISDESIKNAQDAGSVITYFRRYSIISMLGLAPDDDDDALDISHKEIDNSVIPNKRPSDKQFNAMYYKVKENGCGIEDFNNVIKTKATLSQYKSLMENFTKERFDNLVKILKEAK